MTGRYDVKGNKEVCIRICNLSHEPLQVEQREIMAVFDTLVQPPVDAFRPEGKEVDKELDAIDASSKKQSQEIWEHMDIVPLNYAERAELRQIIKDNIDTFAVSADDIGSFTGFPYELKYG